jgi:glycine/D-amino acid oxidase-like deaminating enzyme
MVRASQVVLAGNIHLGNLMPRLAATLLPVSTFVMVTEPIANLSEVVRTTAAVSDTNRADNHYRIVGGDRLQWSGRMRAWQAEPRGIGRGLAADIRRNFPALGKIDIAHLWRGTLGRTIHRMPQIGEVERGVWLASGFGGHGLNTSAMGGELVARGMVDNDQAWRLAVCLAAFWRKASIGGRRRRTASARVFRVTANGGGCGRNCALPARRRPQPRRRLPKIWKAHRPPEVATVFRPMATILVGN